MAVKAFFKWLAGQPGYKSRIRYSDADYFNSSANDERIAKAVRERPVPTPEQILHALRSMPTSTLFERRDRALVAFTLLSGARDNAIASMKLRHVDMNARSNQSRRTRGANPEDLRVDLLPCRRKSRAHCVGMDYRT